MLVPITFPECWFVDTNARLTEEQYVKLWTTDLKPYSAAVRAWAAQHGIGGPVFPDGIGRYGPLYANGVGEDLTSGELVVATQTCAAAGRKGGVVMFQHVRRGDKNAAGQDIGWIPSDDLGLKDAQTIVGYADSIGYSVTYAADFDGPQLVPHVIEDQENVQGAHSSLGMSQAWRDFVASAKRVQPAIYHGFNPGMSDAQFTSLGVPVAKDMGPRQSSRGFVYEQVGWVTVPGLGQFDIAHVHADATGAALTGIGWAPDLATTATEPAPPPSGAAA